MPRKILLADDSVTAQNMGRRILSDAGYEVITVNNGSAALKKITEHKPDLVILDVYMPGYGGIELCQRLKDNAETAHIPVLLTVGKLEPFKAEEARRVRADSHLIKPFEATELLTALTKLEQKIAPAVAPRAATKATKKSEAGGPKEKEKDKDRKFGDNESGWKQRLTIPSAKPAEEVEEIQEEPAAKATAFRSFTKNEEAEPEKENSFADEVASLAPGITPEEMAAIASIAATFGEKPETATEPESHQVESANENTLSYEGTIARTEAVSAELPVEPFADALTLPAAQPEISAAPAAAVEAAIAPEQEAVVAPIEINTVAQPAIENEPVVTVSEANTAVDQSVPDSPAAPFAIDADLAAALDALGPATHATADVSANSKWAVSNTVAGRPRWIAEQVALTGNEATFILEQEMEKALAAMSQVAAVQAGWTEIRQYRGNDVPAPAKHSYETPSPEPEISPVLEEVTPHVEAAPTEPEAADAVASSEIQVHESARDLSEVAQAGPEEVAYAAAASASSEFRSISHPEPVSPVTAPEESHASAAASALPDAAHEAELAAAWAHWRSIRGSIANPQLTDQVASVAAAGYQEMQKAASASAQSNGSSSAAPDTSAIASIVDSVLAELKPKLMEEIAKKLAKDK